MNPRKLYYEDCHLRHFSAQVLSCEKVQKGFHITLDQTAFYPEGGGQASDVGTLGTVRVLHTAEVDDQVVHLCDGPLEVGSTVEGAIDYAHRFDLMQQHSGEHMVSGLLHARFGAHNTGFHMGSDVTTIDFDVEIPAQSLPEIEAQVNDLIWQNLPVKCWYPAAEDLSSIPYRSKKALDWPVRLVQYPGVDICACCGVHVAYTGEIGLVKLLSCVRFRGGSRIEMLCGKRALDRLNGAFVQNLAVSRAFSAKEQETGAAAEKMNQVLAQQKYRLVELENRIFTTVAESLSGCGDVLVFHPGLDAKGVRRLADAIAQHCAGVAAVFSGDDENGYAYALVQPQGDLNPLCKNLNQTLNGRGGGRGGFCQGSVHATQQAIRDFFPGYFQ